jgi:hypothetical protein
MKILKITGACHCGAIRYEAEVDPATAGVCHCTDCQVLSGTAFRVSVRAVPDTFRILDGKPRVYIKTADSGNQREQAFCETCGSPIYAATPGAQPKIYSIRAGTIDQRAELRPLRQIWTHSQLPWLGELVALPGIEKQGH